MMLVWTGLLLIVLGIVSASVGVIGLRRSESAWRYAAIEANAAAVTANDLTARAVEESRKANDVSERCLAELRRVAP